MRKEKKQTLDSNHARTHDRTDPARSIKGGRRHPRDQIPRRRALRGQHGHAQLLRRRRPGRHHGPGVERTDSATGQQPGVLRVSGGAAGDSGGAEGAFEGHRECGRAVGQVYWTCDGGLGVSGSEGVRSECV